MKIITDEKELTPLLIEGILHNTISFEQVVVKEIKIIRTFSTVTFPLKLGQNLRIYKL